MRIEQIQTALQEGIPFEIATARGDKFGVSDRSRMITRRKEARWFW